MKVQCKFKQTDAISFAAQIMNQGAITPPPGGWTSENRISLAALLITAAACDVAQRVPHTDNAAHQVQKCIGTVTAGMLRPAGAILMGYYEQAYEPIVTFTADDKGDCLIEGLREIDAEGPGDNDGETLDPGDSTE